MKRLITVATWSSGMIPASGAGGPGFNSRSGPNFLHTLYKYNTYTGTYLHTHSLIQTALVAEFCRLIEVGGGGTKGMLHTILLLAMNRSCLRGLNARGYKRRRHVIAGQF